MNIKSIIFLYITLITSFICYTVQAQDANSGQDTMMIKRLLGLAGITNKDSDTLRLNLDEAVRFAISKNRSLQNATFEIRRAHAQRWQSIAKMLPQADLGATFSDDFQFRISIAGISQSLPNSISHTLTSSITLNGPLIIGALLQKTATTMQEINKEISENTLIENVNNTYMTILITERVIELEKKYLANLQTLYQQMVKAVEVGVIERTQADLIKINVNKLKTSLNNNLRALEITENAFKTLLVVELDTKIILTEDFQEHFSQEKLFSDVLTVFQPTHNLNYMLAEQNLKMAKQNWQLAGWQFAPTLSVVYRYEKLKYFGTYGMNMTPTNLFTVSVTIPLLTSGDNVANIVDKKLAYLEQKNNLDDIKDNLTLQYKQLVTNLVNSFENYLTEQENIDAIDRVLQDVTNKQKWGVSSTQELISATDDLIQSQQSYLSTMLDLIQNKTALKVFLNNK